MVTVHTFLTGIPLIAAFSGSLVSACLGQSCLGKDPDKQGCSADATTKKQYSVGQITVQIRYSPTCRAWWARATCERPSEDATAALYVNIFQYYGRQTYSQRIVGDHAVRCAGGGTSWTYMLNDRDDGDHYNACWDLGNWGSPQSPKEGDALGCTGRI